MGMWHVLGREGGGKGTVVRILVGKPKGKRILEDPDVDASY
jgi:ABC-type Mn2+/Zn2+ transport system ATPase subunit